MMLLAARWTHAEDAVADLDVRLDEASVRRAQMALRVAIAESLHDDRPWARRVERLEPRILHAIVELRRRRHRAAAPRPAPQEPAPRKVGMTWEESREHKKARHKVVRGERLAKGLCTSCGRTRDLDGVTCSTCLRTDKAWRKSRAVREKTAEFLDDECQPLVLKFRPRMLPVPGNRYDCLRTDDCLTELIRACGRQDAPGSSCPKPCPDRIDPRRDRELEHLAMTRDEAV